MLYQARLDPRRSARMLTDAEILRLRASIKRVVDTSVRVLNDSDRYPRGWAGSSTGAGGRTRVP